MQGGANSFKDVGRFSRLIEATYTNNVESAL